MTEKIDALIARLHEVETELQAELESRNARLRGKFSQIDEEITRRHQLMRVSVFRYITQANLLFIITAPVIYSLIIAFALLDISVTIYQHICFRVYKIPLVKRKNYFVYDRGQLKYLNAIEKFNCAYCSYGNGVIAYAREIAALTEKFWCPIKHAQSIVGTHRHYHLFENFGDAENYQPNLIKHRNDLSHQDQPNK